MKDRVKSSNSLEKLLLENADEALFLYSLAGELIYVNPAFEIITGYSVAELYEKNFITYVHPEDQQWTKDLWQGLLSGEVFEDAEYRIIKKDGEIRWSLSTWKMVYDQQGEKIGIQGKQQDITKRKLIEIELIKAKAVSERLANTDVLTGLNNRRAFFEQGNRIFDQAKDDKHAVSVIMMDLDYFKKVNDDFGHSTGDEVLKWTAKLILKALRKVDIVGRIGGEEFAFVLPETSLKEAQNLAERIGANFTNIAVDNGNNIFKLTASFGVYASKIDDETLDDALIKADNALYSAKNNGRNQIVIYE
jgi:diguanylate cyclase (GGDEF)-like protein/PAS domain S-box-containing protein